MLDSPGLLSTAVLLIQMPTSVSRSGNYRDIKAESATA